MKDLIKQEDKIALIEYIPTVEDLQFIFERVQSPDKVPANEIRCQVQAVPKIDWKLSDGLYLKGQPEDAKTITYITLYKFRDGDHDIWIYEGKVKA